MEQLHWSMESSEWKRKDTQTLQTHSPMSLNTGLGFRSPPDPQTVPVRLSGAGLGSRLGRTVGDGWRLETDAESFPGWCKT